MGHTQSAQHNFHQQYHQYPIHPHHHHPRAAYHRPPGPGGGGEIIVHEDGIPRWSTHSFPRDPTRVRIRNGPNHPPLQLQPEHRVLPNLFGPPPKLKSTENGNILHNGGTISGKKFPQPQHVAPVKAYRARHDPRMQMSRPGSRNGLITNRMKFGGSEPDLRAPSPVSYQHQQPPPQQMRGPSNRSPSAAAAKKKYKAPPPPSNRPIDSESPSDTTMEDSSLGQIPRRARLFKTRAQQSSSSSSNNNNNSPRINNKTVEENKGRIPLGVAATNFLAQRSVSSPEFQLEIVRAAQRKHKERLEKQAQNDEIMKTSPTPSGPRHAPVGREASGDSRENIRSGSRSHSPVSIGENKRKISDNTKPQAPKPPPPVTTITQTTTNTPKTFYFGMDMNTSSNALDEDEVDRFAARIRDAPNRRRTRSSSPGSGVSAGGSACDEPGDINLQLRPTLPKKTPDIPRFSPTAAWRQLLIEPVSNFEQNEDSETEKPVLRSGTAALLEERIVQSLLQRVPMARGSAHEKSGDSGISGDASPSPGGGVPDVAIVHPRSSRSNNRQWTPEQDLDETSSEDEHRRTPEQNRRTVSEERPGETAFRSRSNGRVTPPKFIRRSHMFSLSLPRPESKTPYDDTESSPNESPSSPEQEFHSLQKSRRCMSQQQLSFDDNWYFSKSAPNSLDSGGGDNSNNKWGPRAISLKNPPPQDILIDEDNSPSTPAFSYLAGGGHIMYLPEYDSRRTTTTNLIQMRSRSVDMLNYISREQKQQQQSLLQIAPIKIKNKSIDGEMREKRPESPWGEQFEEEPTVHQQQKTQGQIPIYKSSKRFTFQSTIRQIERRKIADKLSKEAERKEKERKMEAEAMKKVEEEFQRKRAKEKASLKEQLRLFSLEEQNPMFMDAGPQSLPIHLINNESSRGHRVEPEGAANNNKNNNQINGEKSNRQEPREYKDYTASPARINSRYPSGEIRNSPTPTNNGERGGKGIHTKHPPVVLDIPKKRSTQIFVKPSHNTAPVIVGEIPRKNNNNNMDHDNYRLDFARGVVPGVGGGRSSSPRSASSNSRSSSNQDSGASSRALDNFNSLPPNTHQDKKNSPKSLPRIPGVTPAPFGVSKSKAYRPIGFKPPSSSNNGNKSNNKLPQVVN